MEFAEHTTWLLTLALVIARVAGVVAVAPVFGHEAVPVRLRLLAAVVIGLAVQPRLGGAALPAGDLELALAMVSQVLLGLAIGYAVRLVFVGVELGAFHVSQQMGLSLGEVFDPISGQSQDAVRRLMQMLALVVFLLIGGHRVLIGSMIMTFEAVPLTGFAGPSAVLGLILSLLAAAFVLALKVAGPVLIAMLLAAVAMGFLQKTVPQCNILSIGLPIRALLGLIVLAATLTAMSALMEGYLGAVMKAIRSLLAS